MCVCVAGCVCVCACVHRIEATKDLEPVEQQTA